jgi:hemerythrin-like metal-binding protein
VENFLKWRQEWLLGIKPLDKQHQRLAERIDQLARLYIRATRNPEGAGDSRMKLIGRLNLLYGECEQHFRDEEKRMLDSGYHGYKNHAYAHVMFLAELKGCCQRVTTGNEELDMGTLYSLKTWFITHILDDMEFASYVHATEAGDGISRQASLASYMRRGVRSLPE